MRWELGNEWVAFARSFGEGAALSLLFDLFRMARVHFRWKDYEVALMDLFYWLLAAPIAFLFLLRSYSNPTSHCRHESRFRPAHSAGQRSESSRPCVEPAYRKSLP